MSLSKDYKSMIDAAVIRVALPRCPAKRLSTLMRVPERTAKHWIYNGVARGRVSEVAAVLLAEMEREDRRLHEERTAARHHLLALAQGFR